jgi:RNA-binding protein
MEYSMTEQSEPENTPEEPEVTDKTELQALAGFQRKHLRGLAHNLEPVVQVGKAGLTEELVATVLRALEDHELIKVSMTKPKDKKGMSAELARRANAHLCGLLGHTMILYRERSKGPAIRVPTR